MKAADHFLQSCLPEHPPSVGEKLLLWDLIQNVESLMQVLCGFLPVLHKGCLGLFIPHLCFSFLKTKKLAFTTRDIIYTSKHCPVVGGWGETRKDQILFCQYKGKLKALIRKGLPGKFFSAI